MSVSSYDRGRIAAEVTMANEKKRKQEFLKGAMPLCGTDANKARERMIEKQMNNNRNKPA